MIKLDIRHDSWPVRGHFTISRGSRTHANVVTVTLVDGAHRGRGECVPYARYGESIESVTALIDSLREEIRLGADTEDLQSLLPPGAARNALDCALWDLKAKRAGKSVFELLGLPPAKTLTTAFTLSLDSPDAMQRAAVDNSDRPILKLKLGGEGDIDRVAAVAAGAPDATLILDANEAWSTQDYERMIPRFADLGVAVIEQPFPAGDDSALTSVDRPITICADESCHDRASLDAIIGKYDMINIKLDKTGGLTEALQVKRMAQKAGLEIMVGCMLGSSLAMAPACVVAQDAELVDLDGPLLLAADHDNAIQFENSQMAPVSIDLWG